MAKDGFPELEILSDIDSFVSHYLFLVTIFFYIIVLILTITFISELSNSNRANTDKFTTILNLVSFISLTLYLIGELIYELSLINNIVFSLFATRINLCFFNCFMFVLSTPLSPEEESELIEGSEKDRKEFGSELKVSNIDHLDKYNPESLEETSFGDDDGLDDVDSDEDLDNFDIDVNVNVEDRDYSFSGDGEEEYDYNDRENETDSEEDM